MKSYIGLLYLLHNKILKKKQITRTLTNSSFGNRLPIGRSRSSKVDELVPIESGYANSY